MTEPGNKIVRKAAAEGLDSDKVRFEPQAVIRGCSCHSSGRGNHLAGADWRLCVYITFFTVPCIEDQGQLPFELLFGDVPIPECITKMPDPNLCIGQGFKGSVFPLG